MLSASVSHKNFQQIRKVFQKIPRDMSYAASRYLTELAYEHRQHGMKVLHSDMTIRNESLLRTSLLYDRADWKAGLGNMKSYYGSVARSRFTGWEEQETGKPTRMQRTPTVAARRNTWNRRIDQAFRAKPGRDYLHLSQFPGKNKTQRMAVMLAQMERMRRQHLIWLSEQTGRMSPGLWQYRPRSGDRKFTKIYAKDPLQPKRQQWMLKTNRTIRINPQVKWEKILDRVLPK